MSSDAGSDPAPSTDGSPCTACGACCASFRVSFYWSEGDDAPGGWPPVALTQRFTPHLRMMRGTGQRAPRCEALAGEVGRTVRCTIYTRRPTPCREFRWHGEDRQPNPRCNARRAAIGLPALPDPTDPTSPVLERRHPDATPIRGGLNRSRNREKRA